MCIKLGASRRSGGESGDAVLASPYPLIISGPTSSSSKPQGVGRTLARAPSPTALRAAPDRSPSAAPFGPHSFRCPFKKEEILFINKRPNLSGQSTAFPSWVPGNGSYFQIANLPQAQPWGKAHGRPFLRAALDCSRLERKEPVELGGGLRGA